MHDMDDPIDDTEITPDPGGWVAYALLIACVIIIGLYAVAMLLSI